MMPMDERFELAIRVGRRRFFRQTLLRPFSPVFRVMEASRIAFDPRLRSET